MHKPETQPRLLRLKAAADYLSMSPRMLRAIIQRDELPVIKANDQAADNAAWRLDRQDLDAWIDSHKSAL